MKTVFILLLTAAPALPWGCEGHQAVALIAMKQLGAHALALVNQLLAGQPIDPTLNRFCGPNALPVFADVSTWADDIRKSRPDTAESHFIDIPLGAAPGNVSAFCPAATGCVTSAIAQKIDILRAPGGPSTQKVEALMFLIHFVGDLHQPLHATTNNDRGANCVPVTFFGTKPKPQGPPAKEDFKPNLHGVWDTDMIQRNAGAQTVSQLADQLSQKFSAQIAVWKQQPVNVEGWAWESHQNAVTTSYGKLHTAVPVEVPQPVTQCSDDNHVSLRMKNLKEKIDAAYLGNATPVIEEQLTKAGTRLAMLLNQLAP